MAEHSYPELGGKIVLDTSELGKSIKYLQDSIATIRQTSALAINQIEGGEKSVKGLSRKLNDLSDVLKKQGTIVEKYQGQLDKLILAEGQSSDKVVAKKKALADAKVSYANTQKAIADYEKALEKAEEKEKYGIKALDNLGESVSKFSPKLGMLISKFADWRVVAGSVATTLGVALVKGLSESIKAAAEYETAFTNVRKTVDGTETQFEMLNNEITKMSMTMPKTAAEIAEVAALGGQLGVAVDSLGEFTETMIKLGDSTTLTADQAGEMIAQIAAITGMTTSDYERFGSAVVELGNNFATTESKMLETTQRISRFSKSVGLNVEEVLALSTALSALGLESDASGTAMQKIFSQIQLAVETTNEDLEGFAKVAGLTTSEFQALWKSSSMKGFQSFIKGMAALDDAGQSTVATLDELGINEVRLTSVLQAITSNTEILDEALEMTNEAWAENVALTEEAEKKYSTLQNQVQIAKNSWAAFGKELGDKFLPILKEVVGLGGSIGDYFANLINPALAASNAISNVQQILTSYTEQADKAAKAGEEVSKTLRESTRLKLAQELKTVSDRYDKLNNLQKEFISAAQEVDSSITDVAGAMKLIEKTPTPKNAEEFKAESEEVNNLRVAYTNWLTETGGDLEEMETLVNSYAAAVSTGLFTKGNIAAYSEEFGSAVFAAGVELYNFQLEQEGAKKSADRYMESLDSLANNYIYLSDKLDLYQTELTTLESVSERLKEEYGENSAEYLAHQAIIESLTESVKKYKDEIENAGTYSLEDATTEYEKSVAEEATETEKKITDLEGKIEELNTALAEPVNFEQESEILSIMDYYNKKIKELKKEADMSDLDAAAKSYTSELYKTNKALTDARTTLANLKAMNKEGWSTEEIEYYNTVVKAVEDEIQNLLTPAAYSADTILSQYGSDAQKLEVKIRDVETQIASLTKEMETATGESKEQYQIAIDTLEAYEKSLKVSNTLSFMEKLGGYIKDYWGQITDIITDNLDIEVEAIDSKIEKLESNLENKEQQIDDAATARQKDLDAAREAGTLSEIAYYKESAKAAEQAENDKRQAEKETAAQKEKLLKEQDELKRKQFNADKANSIADATIEGAIAAVKCISDLGPIAGAIAAVTVAGITAAQIATIAKQNYVPALATGGITTGPTYALIGDNTSGQEAVLPLESKTMQLLAGKIVDEMNRPNSNVTYNNQKTDDSRSYTINQTITPPGGMTKREAYLQARKALRESRRY